MTDAGSELDPLDQLAEDFLARLRRGERPSVEEYAARHLGLAADIRDTFPVLVAVEGVKTAAGEPDRPVVPGYRVLGLIGHGGMGDVYEAVQEALGRRVALKVLRPRGRLTDAFRERFRREARAAGRLHHTNIVPVFDSGEADGTPYFAMQLIPGRGLDAVLAAVRRERLPPPDGSTSSLPAAGRSTLNVTSTLGGAGREYHRTVARLLADAALALAHAHRQGVLHRDVKPSNLLLDEAGAIWVTDFGLAKADDGADLTDTGDVVGTVRYMAPERFDGRADPRSDVYALGVTAYEFATLSPAYDGPADQGLIKRILAGPPAAPRSVDATVPRDLETVILKATAPNPAHRYPTADDLAADLRRFADGLPVEARRVSAAEAVWRAARRNPLVAGLVTAVLVVSVAGAGGAGWYAWRAEERADGERRAKGDADTKRQEAEVQRQVAETEKANALLAAAAEKAANEQAQIRLRQIEQGNAIILSVFDDIDHRTLKHGGEPLEVVLARRLSKTAELLEGEAIGNPLVVAALQTRLGLTLLNLGFPRDAIPLFQKARATEATIRGGDHPATLTNMNYLAMGYQAAGKLDLALPLFEETLTLRKATLGADHRDTLTSMSNLALCLQDAGKLALALPLFEETLKLRQATSGGDHPLTMIGMNNLALGYQAAGKLDLALPLFEDTLKLMKAKLGADHPDTLTCMNNLADAYRVSGKLALALPLFEETFTRRRAKLGADHPLALSSMNNLATGYRAVGKLDQAVTLSEEALAIMQTKLGADHPLTLAGMGSLAGAYRAAGKHDLAVPLFEKVLSLRKTKLGENHPETLAGMGNLAAAYWSVKRLDRSIPLLEEMLKLQEVKQGRDHPDALWAAVNLGVNYKDAGRVAEALPLLEEAFRSSSRHPSLRWAGSELLDGYVRADKPAEAIALVAELLIDARSRSPKGSPQLANALAQYGLALLQLQAHADAEPLLRECLAIREKTLPTVWVTFNTRSMLGGALLGQKKYDDAEPLLLAGYKGMKEREKEIPAVGRNRLLDAADRLVEVYTASNQPDERKAWQAERAKLRETLPTPRLADPSR